jgi:hypothetical protein
MCSGCSGEYEGEGEDLAGMSPDSCENRDSDLDAGSSDSSRWARPPRADDLQKATSDEMARRDAGAEDYQVFVSAERIIEVRSFLATCFLSGGPDANQKVGGGEEGMRAREHSRRTSAKSYGTRRQFEVFVSSLPSGLCKQMLWSGLALLILAGAALWLTFG